MCRSWRKTKCLSPTILTGYVWTTRRQTIWVIPAASWTLWLSPELTPRRQNQNNHKPSSACPVWLPLGCTCCSVAYLQIYGMPSWTKTRALFHFFQLKHALQQHADIIGFLKQNALGGQRRGRLAGDWKWEWERWVTVFSFWMRALAYFSHIEVLAWVCLLLQRGRGSAGLWVRPRMAVKFVRLVVLDVSLFCTPAAFPRAVILNSENNKSFSTYASACCCEDTCTHNT